MSATVASTLLLLLPLDLRDPHRGRTAVRTAGGHRRAPGRACQSSAPSERVLCCDRHRTCTTTTCGSSSRLTTRRPSSATSSPTCARCSTTSSASTTAARTAPATSRCGPARTSSPHPVNLGQGAAIQTGVEYARSRPGAAGVRDVRRRRAAPRQGRRRDDRPARAPTTSTWSSAPASPAARDASTPLLKRMRAARPRRG